MIHNTNNKFKYSTIHHTERNAVYYLTLVQGAYTLRLRCSDAMPPACRRQPSRVGACDGRRYGPPHAFLKRTFAAGALITTH